MGILATQAPEPGPEVGLGVQQKLGRNHDPVTLLEPGPDDQLILAQVIDLHWPRLETPTVPGENHPRALAG